MPTALATSAPGALDEVLERLAGVLQGTSQPGSPGDGSGTSSSPDPVPSPAPSVPTSTVSPRSLTPEQLQEIRASVATDVAYLLAIPPLTQDRYREIDEAFENLFHLIKVSPYRPYVMSMLDHVFGRQPEGSPHGQPVGVPPLLATVMSRPLFDGREAERSAGDAELAIIAQEMGQNILGDAERVIPLAAAVFYVVGGTAAGATIGYHVGKIIKNL